MKALMASQLKIAKNAFARLKSTKHLNLVEHIRYKEELIGNKASTTPAAPESRRAKSKESSTQQISSSWHAEVLAYEGHHLEAAKMYARDGNIEEAIRLMVDLKRYILYLYLRGLVDKENQMGGCEDVCYQWRGW